MSLLSQPSEQNVISLAEVVNPEAGKGNPTVVDAVHSLARAIWAILLDLKANLMTNDDNYDDYMSCTVC